MRTKVYRIKQLEWIINEYGQLVSNFGHRIRTEKPFRYYLPKEVAFSSCDSIEDGKEKCAANHVWNAEVYLEEVDEKMRNLPPPIMTKEMEEFIYGSKWKV